MYLKLIEFDLFFLKMKNGSFVEYYFSFILLDETFLSNIGCELSAEIMNQN